jgi:hypothetical protein
MPKTKFNASNSIQPSVYPEVCKLMKTSIALALACLQYTEAANTTTYETLIQ